MVKISPAIFHPNIDFDGSVCVNFLRETYQPSVTIRMIVEALDILLNDYPSHLNYLNKEVATILEHDKPQFEFHVNQTLRGESYKDIKFKKFKE